MDVTPILESLNDAQRQAVTAPETEPLLVIAGAGSGKTRVLTHRAAWLIDVVGVPPQGLLAVTFTNKAAAEMRSRIEHLLNMPVNHLWIGTFHGLAHRLLRRHWQEAKLPQNFQIIDADDQQRIIKRLIKNLEVDDDRWAPARSSGSSMPRKTKVGGPPLWMIGLIPTSVRCTRSMSPMRPIANVWAWSILANYCCVPASTLNHAY